MMLYENIFRLLSSITIKKFDLLPVLYLYVVHTHTHTHIHTLSLSLSMCVLVSIFHSKENSSCWPNEKIILILWNCKLLVLKLELKFKNVQLQSSHERWADVALLEKELMRVLFKNQIIFPLNGVKIRLCLGYGQELSISINE